MFCPDCGAHGQSASAYCKRCGEWLPDLKSSRVKWGGETPEQHLKVILFLNGFSALVALLSAILLYATQPPGGMKWPVGLAAAFCVSIAAWQISSCFIGFKLRRRLKRGREENTRPRAPGEPGPAPLLDEADTLKLTGAEGVAENATELLAPSVERMRGGKR
jgi:hypothetical protein